MCDQPLSLPIQPSSPSLHSHLAALDILSLRLAALTSKTTHTARIPLTSKASVSGQIIHTNDVKVNVGAGWWVEMTAAEAAQYVQRRKAALLEEHARLAEGHLRPAAVEHIDRTTSSTTPTAFSSISNETPRISFHPIFSNSAISGPSNSSTNGTPTAQQALVTTDDKSDNETPNPSEPSLVDIISTESHRPAQTQSNDQGDDPTLNEEGLPFQEIRESLDGRPLGPIPPVSGSFTTSDPSSSKVEEEDNYWSEESIRRRAELRRRIFHEGSDTEEEDDVEDADAEEAQSAIPMASQTLNSPPAPTTSPPELLSESSPPSDMLRRPSASPGLPPKSILKPPTRKKSVSFDSSVPVTADSPQKPSAITAQKFGFPLPLAADDGAMDEYAPKPVPVIATPQPPNRAVKGIEEKGFAGFKRGFLSGPSKTSPPEQTAPSTPPVATAALPSTSTAMKPVLGERHVSFTEDTAPPAPDAPEPKRKTSLFAQRLADREIDPSAPASASGITPHAVSPSLSKMSENKPMIALKSSVVEKAPAVRNALASPSAVRSAIPPTLVTESSRGTSTLDGDDLPDEDEDDEDDGDLGEYSSGEEDEYDLDDALLAREVALDYHRRQAYQPLNRDPNDPASDILGPDDYGASPYVDTGVVLGLPRIGEVDQGAGPTIINPTPEDLRRFVRVGRLENGNLVLAPGEEGYDSASDDGDEHDGGDESVRERRREIRARREDIKRKLMGLTPEHDTVDTQDDNNKTQEEGWKATMPPSIQPAVAEQAVERTPSSTSAVIDQPVVTDHKPVSISSEQAPVASAADPTPPPTPAPTKKVSRFKAARMAAGGA